MNRQPIIIALTFPYAPDNSDHTAFIIHFNPPLDHCSMHVHPSIAKMIQAATQLNPSERLRRIAPRMHDDVLILRARDTIVQADKEKKETTWRITTFCKKDESKLITDQNKKNHVLIFVVVASDDFCLFRLITFPWLELCHRDYVRLPCDGFLCTMVVVSPSQLWSFQSYAQNTWFLECHMWCDDMWIEVHERERQRSLLASEFGVCCCARGCMRASVSERCWNRSLACVAEQERAG